MRPIAYWWVFGFLSALMLVGIGERAGVAPGQHASGFIVLLIVWVYACVNAVKNQ